MVHRLLPTFLLVLLLSVLACGQGLRPYNPSSTTNTVLTAIGGTVTGVSVMLDKRVIPLTEDQLEVLTIDKVWGIDRFSTRHLSLEADEFTDKLLLAGFASPFLLMLDRTGRENFNDMALIVFQGGLINAGLINLTKVLVRRARPYNYNPDAPLDTKMRKSSRYSFYSGHTATSAYFSMTAAKLYSDLHPDAKNKGLMWAAAAAIPVAVSYGRMRAGRHFFTDVLVGFVTGTAIALTVPSLHKRATGE